MLLAVSRLRIPEESRGERFAYLSHTSGGESARNRFGKRLERGLVDRKEHQENVNWRGFGTAPHPLFRRIFAVISENDPASFTGHSFRKFVGEGCQRLNVEAQSHQASVREGYIQGGV